MSFIGSLIPDPGIHFTPVRNGFSYHLHCRLYNNVDLHHLYGFNTLIIKVVYVFDLPRGNNNLIYSSSNNN